MIYEINAFKYFKIGYSAKWKKDKQNNGNQEDRGQKMAKIPIMFYTKVSGRKIIMQILFDSYNPS